MNNKDIAAAVRAMDSRQNKCRCLHVCCSECSFWGNTCEDSCNILGIAAEALERADDYEKILADFSEVVNDGFQAMSDRKEKKKNSGWISIYDQDNRPNGEVIAISMVHGPGSYKKYLIGHIVENPESVTGFSCERYGMILHNVTHWMPKPEGPEEGTQ